MKSKRLKASLLCSLLIMSMLVSSCGNKDEDGGTDKSGSDSKDTTTTEQVTTETTTVISDDLPEKDYNDYEFRVAIYGGSEQNYDMVTAGEEIGEVLQDAVFLRNRAVEERYNIKYKITETTELDKIHASVMADSDDYDLIFYPICYSASLANQGDYLPFSKLPNVNLDKPWWDAKLREGLSISNNLYAVSGDISPSSLNMTSCLLFNKDLFTSLDLAYPYELVRSGKWTLDAFSSLIKDQTIDLNGDSKIDTDNDRFGLASWMHNVPFSLYYGSGGMTVVKDKNDIPSINIDMNLTTQIFEKVYDIIYNQNSYFAINTAEEYEKTYRVFSENRALMIDTTLLGLDKIRDMDADYGIVPIPKFNEEQESYISFVNAATSMISVPITVRDTERTGIVLEAMASESYYNLTPKFKEVVLKTKRSRDDDSSEMIDIIIRNRVFDIGYINSIPGTSVFMRELLLKKSKDITSHLAKTEKQSQDALNAIIDQISNS